MPRKLNNLDKWIYNCRANKHNYMFYGFAVGQARRVTDVMSKKLLKPYGFVFYEERAVVRSPTIITYMSKNGVKMGG